VAALAFAARIVVVGAVARTPVGLSDPALYARFARSIADGQGYSSLLGQPTSYYPPGYPLALGALQWVLDQIRLGDHLAAGAGLVQAVLGGIAAGATVVAGRHLGAVLPGGRNTARTVGLAAGMVLALWPNLATYSAALLSESLFVTAAAVFVAAVLAAGDLHRPRPVVVAVGAVALAVATLTRPQVVLVIPALCAAWLVAAVGWRRVGLAAAVLVGAVVLAVTPWTVRNAVVMGHPVVLSTNGGDNLCIGFHDGATGGFALSDACATVDRYVDGPDAEVRRDAELRDRALRWIREHPLALPALSARKLALTFGTDRDALRAVQSYEEDDRIPAGVERVLGAAFDVAWWVVVATAVAGVIRLLASDVRRRPGPQVVLWSAAAGAVVPVLFFGDPRFKMGLAPQVALLAGVGLWWALRSRPARPGGP
jgi:hypothetical protein